MKGLKIPVHGPTHLDWEEIGRYLARTLSEWEKSRAEAHLAECAGCRGNLAIKIKSLPFQPLTLDREPRTPGMTLATVRCGWGRLIGPYLTGRMSSVERERMEKHLLGCEGCACQMEIYLQSLDRSHSPSTDFSLFQHIKQWLLKWGLFWRCFWKGRGGKTAQAIPLPKSSSLPSDRGRMGGERAG